MTIFRCPICEKRLNKQEETYKCEENHSYDIAKEGYVHLLPPNKMHSKIPGDNKQMVSSRRRFLETGLYELFSDKLNEIVKEYANTENPVILDAGCGEGYYTGRLQNKLTENGLNPQIFGFDISKFAIKAASKKYKDIDFAVGSIFNIPVMNCCADIVIDVFAPIVESELNRVLKPKGYLILAVPGVRHLYGMKEILYEAPYENEYKKTEYEGFEFLKRIPVKDDIVITDNQTIVDLFTMTPYYYKTGVDGGQRLKETERLKTHIEFDFLIYKKVG
jgi:23S rRNA (guanine745-N1)-methyltransferase